MLRVLRACLADRRRRNGLLAGVVGTLAAVIGAGLPCAAGAFAGSGRTTAAQPAPIRAAFVYPWFPESWKQLQYDPFTNYTPSAGLYDSGAPAVIARQLQARAYGRFDAGILSWWGQGSPTDRRVATILRVTRQQGSAVRWALYVEAESLGDPSTLQIASDLAYIRDHYASRRAYLHIGRRFVVFVYAASGDGCGMADRWKRADTVGAYVVLKVFPGFERCSSQPAGWHQYGPAVAASDQPGYSYTVSPGFYKKGEPAPRLARNPSRFATDVRAMIASGAPFQLVTTFNEWGEGTAVESAREWSSASGYGTYLDILHAAH
jgi:hypothetical protein